MSPQRDNDVAPRATVDDRPAGVAHWLKRRDRRVVATWLLGHDQTVNIVPRSIARLLSAYERAGARDVIWGLLQEFPLMDEPLLWLVRRLTFAAVGRPRGDDDPALDVAIPGSGWPGNLLVLTLWAGAIALVVCLLY